MNDIEKIKERNQAAGQHWFSPSTMRFFRSRVSNEVELLPNGSALFISSEKFISYTTGHQEPRMFTIRIARADGEIDTIGDFQAYRSRGSALRMMGKIAAWCREACDCGGGNGLHSMLCFARGDGR